MGIPTPSFSLYLLSLKRHLYSSFTLSKYLLVITTLYLLLIFSLAMKQPRTLNIHVGRKLSDKSHADIMNEVTRKLNSVIAVQILYEIVRVTFKTDDPFRAAKQHKDIFIFSFNCSITCHSCSYL